MANFQDLFLSTHRQSGASSDYILLELDESQHYDILPFSGLPPRIHAPRRRTSRIFKTAFTRLLFLSVATVLVIVVALTVYVNLAILMNGLPPLYTEIRHFEYKLSVKNTLNGSSQKLLRFPEHRVGEGISEYLQETYFRAYLAYLSNRTLVYDDYVQSHSPFSYTLAGLSLRPSSLPLHAMISRVGDDASGQNSTANKGDTRAISTQWYKTVCPPPTRVKKRLQGEQVSSGDMPLALQADHLAKLSERCLEVDQPEAYGPISDSRRTFDSQDLFSSWAAMRHSPVFKGRNWSPLIQSALSRNLHLLSPPSSILLNEANPHLLAMHIDRGSKQHCRQLANERKGYRWINQHPQLPDRFSSDHVSLAGRVNYYAKHCWVEVQDVVDKAHELRRLSISNSSEPLSSVYIVTNSDAKWIQRVKRALNADGWEKVTTSRDLLLDRWERYLDEAVNMAIAEKAGIFIGNGFSSLTSGVVMLRLLEGRPTDSNRFW